jgi:PAS domain S-box-containing protein
LGNKRITITRAFHRLYLPPVLILVLLLFAWWQAGNWYHSWLISESRASIASILGKRGSALTITMNRKIALLDGLSAYAVAHAVENNLAEGFFDYASGLYAGSIGVRAIEIFRIDEPALVYPMLGNEAILHWTVSDLTNDSRPSVRDDVLRAILNRTTTVSAPYELRQGGLGLVARKPVFFNDQLYGLAVIVLDVPPVLESTGLNEVASDIPIAIRDGSGQVFYGKESVFGQDPVIYAIYLPDGNWELAAHPAGGWEAPVRPAMLQFQGVGLLLIILLMIFVIHINIYQNQLKLAVQLHTLELQTELGEHQLANAALRESEEKFRTLAENSQDYIMRYDRQLRHIYMNPAGIRVSGFREDQIIGKTHRESGFNESLTALWEHGIETVFATGQPYQQLFTLKNHAGEMLLDLRLSPEFDENGIVRSVLGVSRDITQQKMVEEALRESEERFRLLYEQAPLGYQSLDADGFYIDVNQAWLNLLGYEKAEVVGKWAGDFLTDESKMLFEQRFPHFKAAGFLNGAEFRMIRKDGRHITVAVDGRVGQSLDSTFKQTHCILHDVTSRKLAEKALRDSEERLRLALNAANQGLYDINLLTGESIVSPEYASMIGFDPETFRETNNDWRARLHPDDRAEVINAYEDCIAGKREDYRVEFRLLTKSGNYTWILSHGKIVSKDANGRPLRLLGTHTDISEQKRVEQELRESEHRLQHAEAIANMGHWSYDYATRAVFWSDALCRIYHYSLEESGPPTLPKFLSIIHPDDIETVSQKIVEIENTGSGTYEYRHLCASGEIRYITGIAEVTKDLNGKPVTMFGIILDTTTVKQKERELERKNAELERFTYTISHDLKSPLVTVETFLGYLEQDLARGNTARVEQDKQYIRTAVDKMSRLLAELLELSRVGRVISPPAHVTFSQLTSEALALVAGQITENGAAVHICDQDKTLFGDRPRLLQIWQNLIENAVKFSITQETPSIEVGFVEQNRITVFYVRDNGCGIDPRYKEKIFGLFEKLDPTSEGTGLGLAIVKRIVEVYQGKIWVESAGLGHGSCFYFTLPEAVMRENIREENER